MLFEYMSKKFDTVNKNDRFMKRRNMNDADHH